MRKDHPLAGRVTGVYHPGMSVPTAIAIRSFSDRAEALAHCTLRAGEAPRLLAFDDCVGCPTETVLASLEWTRVTGLVPDEDLLHAGQLTAETASAVVERRGPDGLRWIAFGPRMTSMVPEQVDGEVIIDEPGVRAVAFPARALALAHFLRSTGGAGAMIAQLGRRAPELRHVRRWFPPIVQQLDTSRAWLAGWFAASSGGALFLGEEDPETRYRYIEVGIDP